VNQSDSLRKTLEQRRRGAIEQATRKLLGDDDAGVADELKRVDAYTRILDSLPAPARKSREPWLAAVVGSACVLAVGLAWTLRLPTTNIVLKVDAETVNFRLTEALAWTGELTLAGGNLRLSEMASISLPESETRRAAIEHRAWADIGDGSAILAALDVAAGGRVAVERDAGGMLALYVAGGALGGHFDLWGRPTISAGTGDAPATLTATPDLRIPEAVAFAAGGGDVPARIQLTTAAPLRFDDLRVDRLSFGREIAAAPGASDFESTILGGRLVLADVDEEIELRPGDRLALETVDGRLVELGAGQSVSVAFEGKVTGVSLGPRDFARDLRPSVLVWLYHEQRLPFLWSAVAFLWGMIWSAKKMFFA
jgi:hypothetical protein